MGKNALILIKDKEVLEKEEYTANQKFVTIKGNLYLVKEKKEK